MIHLLFLGSSLAALALWTGVSFVRGNFWRERADTHLFGTSASQERPRVEVVVPARDEARYVGAAIRSLVAQRYAGAFRVTLVDDHSDDGTAEAARAGIAQEDATRLSVVPARPLCAGWTGKLNALQSGIDAVLATGSPPDFWLFADADIRHDPENLGALVERARRDELGLISLMVRLHCAGAWERLLIPAFIFFFQALFPFSWVNDRRRRTAAAAGGCMLLSHEALERIGGLQAIRSNLIDDCALAAAVKAQGLRIRIGLTARTRSMRRSTKLGDIWMMVKRTAFAQLGFSYPLLLLTVLAMLIMYVVPPAALAWGIAARYVGTALFGMFAWTIMTLLYVPTVRSYGRPALWALTLPLAAFLYTLMTVDSAIAYASGKTGRWKGRTY